MVLPAIVVRRAMIYRAREQESVGVVRGEGGCQAVRVMQDSTEVF